MGHVCWGTPDATASGAPWGHSACSFIFPPKMQFSMQLCCNDLTNSVCFTVLHKAEHVLHFHKETNRTDPSEHCPPLQPGDGWPQPQQIPRCKGSSCTQLYWNRGSLLQGQVIAMLVTSHPYKSPREIKIGTRETIT